MRNHNFCASCGRKIDLSFLENLPPKNFVTKPLDFKDLFHKMEKTLKRESSLSEEEFEKQWGRFRKYHYKNYSDEEIFWNLVQVIFYSGMKAAIVTSKLPAIKNYLYDFKIVKEYSQTEIDKILSDQNIIRNKAKIKACIENAKIFDGIISNFGSFSRYIESFGDIEKEFILEEIRDSFKQFHFLGGITAYHLMLDLGLKVWKPDRVIRRILFRIGQLDHAQNVETAVYIGRKIAEEVGEPIRYIDIVFVKYGQQGEEEGFGLQNGVCLERNPRCEVCGIKEYCSFKN